MFYAAEADILEAWCDGIELRAKHGDLRPDSEKRSSEKISPEAKSQVFDNGPKPTEPENPI